MELKENMSWDELLKMIDSRITDVKAEDWVGPSEDDPFLVKKLENAIKALEENPIPEWLVKKVQGSE